MASFPWAPRESGIMEQSLAEEFHVSGLNAAEVR